jgi:hypothetical protein
MVFSREPFRLQYELLGPNWFYRLLGACSRGEAESFWISRQRLWLRDRLPFLTK